MLEALGDRANEIVTLAEQAQSDVAAAIFGPYFHFRDKVQEFEAFTIIVNQRVMNVKKLKMKIIRHVSMIVLAIISKRWLPVVCSFYLRY